MEKLKLWSFDYYTNVYSDFVFVYIRKNKKLVTVAKIENNKDLLKNIRFLLVNDFTYDKKYDIMIKIYKENQKSDKFFDYWKARDQAINTQEYKNIEKQKQELLKKY